MSENPRSSTLDPDRDQRERAEGIDNISGRRSGGTSVEYLCDRLERSGHHALLEGVRSRRISAYAAAVEAGFVRRRKTIAGDDCNQARRRAHEMAAVLGPTRANSFACAELPCLSCNHPDAWRALKEVADVYLQSQKGEPLRRSLTGVSFLVSCSCRLQIQSRNARSSAESFDGLLVRDIAAIAPHFGRSTSSRIRATRSPSNCCATSLARKRPMTRSWWFALRPTGRATCCQPSSAPPKADHP